MLSNRSMPPCTIIPVLEYPDVQNAVDWLRGAFGFTLRVQIGDHRAQLKFADACVVVRGRARSDRPCRCSTMVRVEDVDRHYRSALEFGARPFSAPADHPYGERQYSVEDIAGHTWTFSQSIADVNPEDWGGTVGEL
jgi:uncharacterized glyoxalase superfamily protein PhnB